MSVVIETTIGDVIVDLYVKERPNTCLNFIKLCKIKFYNLCVFHKIEKNFIAQAGDPTATGRGGESIFCHLYGDQAKYFDAEFKPRLKHEKLGTLSMVNNGNNMNGSQFFLTLSENLTYLDENHTVFGEVAEGFEVLLKLNDAICDNNNRPYQDIRITHTVILHDPFEDPKGLEIPDASPEPTKEMLESNYIGADEEIDDNKGKTAEEVEEKIKESEAKARATILEMVGDIPDAEVKPPENVLFVCKLNPVTTSEDLEVIFSRFGKILSCEVIKDKKTGESLQYAFIEFEREEDCEAAYFKMDNVLIDDRRIHVDFSQSVSKLYFNRDKLPNTKQFKSNFSLKETDRNDGYDLIFDMEDNAANERSHKSKSSESASKHKSFTTKNKHTSPHEEKRKPKQEERKELSYSDRKYKDKNYKCNLEKESHSYRDYDYSYSANKRETRKDRHHRYREAYSRSTDKSHKYRDAEYSHSSDRNRDSDHKSKSRYSSASTSQSYRDSGHYRKSSPKEYKISTKKKRNDSTSPDEPRSFAKSKGQACDYSNRKKYSDKSDSEEYVTKNKKSKSKGKDIEKDQVKSSTHKLKKVTSGKSYSSKKQKSKMSRSSSVSSSSSTTSSSESNSSLSSSQYKHKRKRHYQKEKELSDSRGKTKSHKKRKYSS